MVSMRCIVRKVYFLRYGSDMPILVKGCISSSGGKPVPDKQGWWGKLSAIRAMLPNRIGRIIVYGLLVGMVVVVSLALWLLPYELRYGLDATLEEQGLHSEVGDASLNPFTGHFALKDVRILQGEEAVFELDAFDASWDWWPMFHNRIEVSDISIAGFRVTVSQSKDTGLLIAGLALPAQDVVTAEAEQPSNGEPWYLVLNSFQLEDSEIRYISPQFNETLGIQHVRLKGLHTQDTDKPWNFDVLLNIAGGNIGIKGEAKPLAKAATVRGDIRLEGFDLKLSRNKRGKWNFAPLLAMAGWEGKAASGSAKAEMRNGKPPVLSYRVGSIELANSKLRFSDDSVSPPFATVVAIRTIRLGAIDSSKAAQKSPLTVRVKLDQYTRINADGYVKPLAAKPTLKLKAKITGLELPPLSSYTGPELGYNLASGQLNADINLRIEQGKINGENQLKIRQLELNPTDSPMMGKLEKQLSMPVDTALDLLRDSDNNIELEVPVKGDISNPQFSLAETINKALGGVLMQAGVSYLKYAFQPYGAIISVVEMAGEATALRLEPLKFQPGEFKPDVSMQEYLGKIANVLKERPELHVRLCGKATKADLLWPDFVIAKREKEKTPLDPKEREALSTLAKQRADHAKALLVQKHGIEADRLLICLPEVDESKRGEPRVELLL